MIRLLALLLAMFVALPAAHAGRTVVINTDAFSDERAGIPALVASINQLNNEFRPVSSELAALNDRIIKVQNDLNAAIAANDSAAAQQHDNILGQLQLDAKRKSDDAAAKIEKRRQALVGPVEAKITAAIAKYAIAKDIDVILDARSNPVYLSPEWQKTSDVTADFITWYKAQPPN